MHQSLLEHRAIEPDKVRGMLICQRYKFIFLRIPKNASHTMVSFLEQYLDDSDKKLCQEIKQLVWSRGVISPSHMTLSDLKKVMPKLSLQDYRIIVVVRNPFDRQVSLYSFYQNLDLRKGQASNVTFSEWLHSDKLVLNTNIPLQISNNHKWRPQIDWLSPRTPNGNHYIIRYENLVPDLEQLCSTLGLPLVGKCQLDRINKSGHRPYWEYYDQENQEIIVKQFGQDFDQLGYSTSIPVIETRSLK